MVEHLVGLQAQTTHTWYVGLWNRIVNATPEAISAELEARTLVRLALMRSTIHLVTARDALRLRPLLAPMLSGSLNGTRHGRSLAGIDRAEVARAGRVLLEAEPLTLTELGTRLAVRWPECEPSALGQAVRAEEALVQVTPRGLWGLSGPARHTSLAHWVGGSVHPGLAEDLCVDELVRRYLGAFGPASVRDVQAWCGLTRLAPVLDRLRPQLRTFTDEAGRELFDLPDAPRPDADTQAPPRLLYDFDNVLLSYDDRSRVSTDQHRAMAGAANGMPPRTVLVDGMTAGTWAVVRRRDAATLTITPFQSFTMSDAAALESEGATLLDFLHAGATHRVQVVRSA